MILSESGMYEDYTDCSHDNRPCFRILKYKKGDTIKQDFPVKMMLIALLEGEMCVTCGRFRNVTIHQNELFFLPQNICVEAIALTPCLLISCDIGREMKMHDRIFTHLRHSLPKEYRYNYISLPIRPLLKEYYKLLINSFQNGINNYAYHQLKREELFIYLLTLYQKVKLAQLFHPMLSKAPQFRDFVLHNFPKYNDIQSFAQAANMSISTFSRKFKTEFGITPLQWINKHKAEAIYNDLRDGDATFPTIADKFGFSSTSYLASFCKKYFDRLPHEIREQDK